MYVMHWYLSMLLSLFFSLSFVSLFFFFWKKHYLHIPYSFFSSLRLQSFMSNVFIKNCISFESNIYYISLQKNNLLNNYRSNYSNKEMLKSLLCLLWISTLMTSQTIARTICNANVVKKAILNKQHCLCVCLWIVTFHEITINCESEFKTQVVLSVISIYLFLFISIYLYQIYLFKTSII